MKTSSITKTEELITTIKESLEAYNKRIQSEDKDSYIWGSEHEYSLKSLVVCIGSIITDVTCLIRTHKVFLTMSTYQERNEINSALSSLNSYMVNSQHNYIVQIVDSLKIKLRPYNIRKERDSVIEFLKEIDTLRAKAADFEESLISIKQLQEENKEVLASIKEQKEQIDTQFEIINEKQENISSQAKEFADKYKDFVDLKNTAEENATKITNKLSSAQTNLDEFNTFIEKIDERETQLQEQANKTLSYDQKLFEYDKEHNKKLDEATKLIEASKTALGYTTATGLSAAFDVEYKKANSWKAKGWWLVFALLFSAITLVIGYWIVSAQDTDFANTNKMIFVLVGRFSMIPFTIYAAYFCASQYNKQNILSNDYAYKTTLSKSIVAFSEQLKDDPEKYKEYLTTVLKEIHQDPLRKRNKSDEDKEPSESIVKTMEMITTLLNKVPNIK